MLGGALLIRRTKFFCETTHGARDYEIPPGGTHFVDFGNLKRSKVLRAFDDVALEVSTPHELFGLW